MRTSIYYLSLLASAISQPLLPESTFNVVCPESEDGFPVYVPHPTDCSLYYQCIGSNPTLMSCPDGLYFDSSLNVCNWPQFVECQNGATNKPESTTSVDTTTEVLIETSTTFISTNQTIST